MLQLSAKEALRELLNAYNQVAISKSLDELFSPYGQKTRLTFFSSQPRSVRTGPTQLSLQLQMTLADKKTDTAGERALLTNTINS